MPGDHIFNQTPSLSENHPDIVLFPAEEELEKTSSLLLKNLEGSEVVQGSIENVGKIIYLRRDNVTGEIEGTIGGKPVSGADAKELYATYHRIALFQKQNAVK